MQYLVWNHYINVNTAQAAQQYTWVCASKFYSVTDTKSISNSFQLGLMFNARDLIHDGLLSLFDLVHFLKFNGNMSVQTRSEQSVCK